MAREFRELPNYALSSPSVAISAEPIMTGRDRAMRSLLERLARKLLRLPNGRKRLCVLRSHRNRGRERVRRSDDGGLVFRAEAVEKGKTHEPVADTFRNGSRSSSAEVCGCF